MTDDEIVKERNEGKTDVTFEKKESKLKIIDTFKICGNVSVSIVVTREEVGKLIGTHFEYCLEYQKTDMETSKGVAKITSKFRCPNRYHALDQTLLLWIAAETHGVSDVDVISDYV